MAEDFHVVKKKVKIYQNIWKSMSNFVLRFFLHVVYILFLEPSLKNKPYENISGRNVYKNAYLFKRHFLGVLHCYFTDIGLE